MITLKFIKNFSNTAMEEAMISPTKAGALTIGNGLSYGDTGIANLINYAGDKDITINEEARTVTVGAGATIRDVLSMTLPKKLILNSVPGTSRITIGGAIANNVHGKNMLAEGCFCDHVENLEIETKRGEIQTVSREANRALFEATCAGLGTTGRIIKATIKLRPIKGTRVTTKATVTHNLSETLQKLKTEENAAAWIDTSVLVGPKIGRGVVHQHKETEKSSKIHFSAIDYPINHTLKILYPVVCKWLSRTLYLKHKMIGNQKKESCIIKSLFPLDKINGWENAYGRSGFYQFQAVIPEDKMEVAFGKIMKILSDHKEHAFLAVLKRTKEARTGILSFPVNGYSLAMDFSKNPSTTEIMKKLYEVTITHDGKIYPAKDLIATREQFNIMYPRSTKQREVLEILGGSCRSKQTERYGL